MKRQNLLLFVLIISFSSCSWLSSFYIINNTNEKIIVSYSLNPIINGNFALKDTIEFYKLILNENGEIDIKASRNSPKSDVYSKTNLNNIEIYSTIIEPNCLITSRLNNLHHFGYTNRIRRDEIFQNLIEMTIIRMDTKDTIILKKSMISDLSRPIGETDIALIFD